MYMAGYRVLCQTSALCGLIKSNLLAIQWDAAAAAAAVAAAAVCVCVCVYRLVLSMVSWFLKVTEQTVIYITVLLFLNDAKTTLRVCTAAVFE